LNFIARPFVNRILTPQRTPSICDAVFGKRNAGAGHFRYIFELICISLKSRAGRESSMPGSTGPRQAGNGFHEGSTPTRTYIESDNGSRPDKLKRLQLHL
jgi:hypothetical protein